MHRKISILILTLLMPFSWACAPKVGPAQTITPPPQQVTTSKEAWQVEWDKTLSLANKEGRVVVYGPPGADTRIAMIEGFKKTYPGITLEWISATGAEVAPKILGERRGGVFLVDIHMGGTTTILSSLKSIAVPIEPLIIHPEARDPSAWMGGKFDFSDREGKLNLVFTNSLKVPLSYNPQLVDGNKLKGASYWEFTKPEWKGKVLLTDPRVAGPGLATAIFYYTTPGLGVDFMRALANNGVILGRDQRLMAEWVGRGKNPIQLSPSELEARALQREGLPLDFVVELKEGTYVTSAFGSVISVDKAPHPNAGKIFLNWLLGREGQNIWSKVSGYPSRRIDIPTDHLDALTVPKSGGQYNYNYKEDQVDLRSQVSSLIRDIFGQ